MCPVIGMLSGAVLDNEFGKRRKEEEELPSKKRKRKMRPKFYL